LTAANEGTPAAMAVPIDRIPPQSLEMEQATLGSMLIDESAIRKVRAIVQPADFYRAEHRRIFDVICGLTDRGEPVDLLTVREVLHSQSLLEQTGGEIYLRTLAGSVVTPSNVEHYAKVVEEKAVCRRILDSATQLQTLAHSDYEDILELARAAGETVSKASVVRSRAVANRPMILRAGAFLQAIGEPPQMLVQRIFPDHSLVLLAGKPKCGKSLAALDLADAVCTGKAVWGLFDVNRPGPVLYLGMEDGKYEIANRLLKRGMRPGDERGLYICPERFPLGTHAGVQQLKALLKDEEIAPVLAIVDTAAEALGIADWSNRGEVADKMRTLREFCREVCSVLVIAHNRKAAAEDSGDEIAGTNAFTGAADGWLSVTKVEKAKEYHRLTIKADGRGGMRDEFVLQMDFDTTRFHALTEEELQDQAKKEQASIRKSKYEAVGAATEVSDKGATVGQISETIGEEIRNTQVIVKEMLQKSLLEATGEKLTVGAGRPAPLYRLTDKGLNELTNKRINESPPYKDSLIIDPDSGLSSPSASRPSGAVSNGTAGSLGDFFGGIAAPAPQTDESDSGAEL
jgi:hypothetical protein